MIGILLVVALVVLGYDIAQIVRGEVDFNRHIPFLYPIVLGVFVWMCIVVEERTRPDANHQDESRKDDAK